MSKYIEMNAFSYLHLNGADGNKETNQLTQNCNGFTAFRFQAYVDVVSEILHICT